MSEYELHKENLKTFHTLIKILETEAEVIRVLIKITKELQQKLEKKGIYYSGIDIYTWAGSHHAHLSHVITEAKSIIGTAFIIAVDNAELEELKALVKAEATNINILYDQISKMNEVSLKLVEHNLMLKKAREFLED